MFEKTLVKKAPKNLALLGKSGLVFFNDAELEDKPLLVRTNWEDVKSYFRGEVKKITR